MVYTLLAKIVKASNNQRKLIWVKVGFQYHKLTAWLKQLTFISHSPDARRPRSGSHHGWCLVRALLACCPPTVPPRGRERELALAVSSKAAELIVRARCSWPRKRQRGEPREQTPQRWGSEGPWARQLLSLWSWGSVPSRHEDVFPDLEAVRTPYFWDFYGGFII